MVKRNTKKITITGIVTLLGSISLLISQSHDMMTELGIIKDNKVQPSEVSVSELRHMEIMRMLYKIHDKIYEPDTLIKRSKIIKDIPSQE